MAQDTTSRLMHNVVGISNGSTNYGIYVIGNNSLVVSNSTGINTSTTGGAGTSYTFGFYMQGASDFWAGNYSGNIDAKIVNCTGKSLFGGGIHVAHAKAINCVGIASSQVGDGSFPAYAFKVGGQSSLDGCSTKVGSYQSVPLYIYNVTGLATENIKFRNCSFIADIDNGGQAIEVENTYGDLNLTFEECTIRTRIDGTNSTRPIFIDPVYAVTEVTIKGCAIESYNGILLNNVTSAFIANNSIRVGNTGQYWLTTNSPKTWYVVNNDIRGATTVNEGMQNVTNGSAFTADNFGNIKTNDYPPNTVNVYYKTSSLAPSGMSGNYLQYRINGSAQTFLLPSITAAQGPNYVLLAQIPNVYTGDQIEISMVGLICPTYYAASSESGIFSGGDPGITFSSYNGLNIYVNISTSNISGTAYFDVYC